MTTGEERREPEGRDGAFDEMQAEIKVLKGKVASLEAQVRSLEASVQEGELIVLRTVTRKQAKREIHDMFRSGQTLYYSDISRRLRIELPLVVEICHQLEQEGEIEVRADDTV